MNWLNRLIVALTAVTISAASMGDEWLRSIPEFELTDHLGEVHTSETYEGYDYVVFYVQGVGCPIARIALPNYRAVRDEFADRNIEFTMFNSNIQDNLPRIAKEAGEFGIDFPIMKDEGSTWLRLSALSAQLRCLSSIPAPVRCCFAAPSTTSWVTKLSGMRPASTI